MPTKFLSANSCCLWRDPMRRLAYLVNHMADRRHGGTLSLMTGSRHFYGPLIIPEHNIITTCTHKKNSVVHENKMEENERRMETLTLFNLIAPKNATKLRCRNQSFRTLRRVSLVSNPHIRMHAPLPQFRRSCNAHLH